MNHYQLINSKLIKKTKTDFLHLKQGYDFKFD